LSSTSSLLIYGAAGFTGKLILAAARKDLPAVGAARRAAGTDSEDLLLLDLGDPDALRRELKGHTLVLNCAGPFAHTWQPLLDACLDTGTHYLDIGAEWEVFEALYAQHDAARQAGIMLLPGVGFDVVASDCLAAHVAARLPGAQRLEIGISGLELVSRGSANTILGLAGQPVRVRQQGAIVPAPALREAQFDFGGGPRAAYAVSWADIITAYYTTGIPDVAVYFEATPLVAGLALANRSFGWSLQTPLLRRLAQLPIQMLPPGPPPHLRAGRRAVLVARAEASNGARVESRLVTPEAYSFTAISAVAAAARVLAGAVRPGFQTPAGLLGADFVLDIAGVERTDLS
jgi:short subunit dehydrogenase-like uncharacterized protein